MKTEIIAAQEVPSLFSQAADIAFLLVLGGERLWPCDEAVVMKDDDGEALGAATIAPNGENESGEPTVIGLYVMPHARRGKLGVNVGQLVFEAAVRRCLERGFARIRVDVLSRFALRIIEKMPPELREKLDAHTEHAGGMDRFTA